MSEDLDDFPPSEIRTATEVARRALALFAVVGIGFRSDRDAILSWLTDSLLWDALSPREADLLRHAEPTRQQIVDATWASESLALVLWALGLFLALPPADEQCDSAQFQDVLPPYADVSVEDFVARSELRSDAELLDMQDRCFALHSQARDVKLGVRPAKEPVDIEVVQERHHAINWIVGYGGGEPWDDVTTDT